ncbi:MAG: hydroxymethylglutaryl-CoA lyase, partial [Thermoleophilia bacterium]|nr:hydroxymethylglutaryl-CoA lyase [Thermoleophilia bacterium]
MTVTICDVGPRDGLQSQPISLEPAVRAELVDLLAAAGVPRVEAVSFVSPTHVPQMAGAEEVVAAIERRAGVVYAGLAVNERGYDRLRESGLDEVHFAFAATEEFNRRNARASVEESVADAERIVARAAADGIRSTVTIGVAFGCPFEGAVDPGRVAELAARLAAAGTGEVTVADTVGVGVPRQVRDLVGRLVPLGLP